MVWLAMRVIITRAALSPPFAFRILRGCIMMTRCVGRNSTTRQESQPHGPMTAGYLFSTREGKKNNNDSSNAHRGKEILDDPEQSSAGCGRDHLSGKRWPADG